MVHVDDLARAHIFLLEYPNAKGRYICSTEGLTIQQMSEFLSASYPEFQIPTPELVPLLTCTVLFKNSNICYFPLTSKLSAIMFFFPLCSSLREVRGYKCPRLSSKKLLDSGFRYKYGVKEMFDGAIQCCREKGYIQFSG